MATFICPKHITSMFEDGNAPLAAKKRGRTLALAWCKSIMPSLKPGDVVLMPDPDTGDLEEYTKSYEPMVS